MKAKELIEELEWAIERNQGEDVEIRIAQQPKWAFEYSVDQAVTVENEKEDGEVFVYLSEGSQIGYLPKPAASELGWE